MLQGLNLAPVTMIPDPTEPPMIKVHHLNNSRSQRVLWLLEELGLPYEIVRYQRDAKTMLAPAALRDIHPLGKSPVLEGEGVPAGKRALERGGPFTVGR